MWHSTRSAFFGTLFFSSFIAGSLRGEVQDGNDQSVTISAEIARGSNAIRAVEYRGYLRSFLQRLLAVVNENNRRGRASEGFLLGANYEIWQRVGIALAVEKEGRIRSPSAVTADARKMRVHAFEEFRRKQRDLGVSDTDLCSALGLLNVAYILGQIGDWEREQAAEAEAAKGVPERAKKERRDDSEKSEISRRKTRQP